MSWGISEAFLYCVYCVIMVRSAVRSVAGAASQLETLADALNAFGLPADWWRFDLLPDELLYDKIHNPKERKHLV